jgi:hypothetical protein
MYRPQDILEELKQQPFEPFRIHVSDGSHYDVFHPDVVVVMTNRLLILQRKQDQAEPIFDRYDSLAMIHITRLEPLPQTKAPTSGPG